MPAGEPQPYETSLYVSQKPFTEVSAGKPFTLKAKIVSANSGMKVSFIIHNSAGGQFQAMGMVRKTPYDYEALIPKELLVPGLLSYGIVIQNGTSYVAFPGNHSGNRIDTAG